MLRTICLVLMLCSSGAALVAADAHAQPKKGASKSDAGRLAKELESGEEARVLAALDQIAELEDAGKGHAPQLDKLLQRGTSAKIAVKALEVAGGLKQPASSAAIAPYVQHRSPDVRRAAARALIKTRGPKAIAALRKALRSSDPQVRGIAATGLGSMGAKDAISDLFAALDHKVSEAAAAIGQLCAVKDCEKLVARLGKLPLDVMTSGLDQILFRPPAEIPDDQKIAIVGRLRELGTKDAGRYLIDVAERWPENWSKKVKQAIDSAVKASGATAKEDE
jgi:HEAT repeat protein